MTVADCFTRIKKLAEDKETINTCYITDSKRKLIGEITIKDLIMADATNKVSDKMNTNIIFVKTDVQQEEVSLLFKKYNKNELPVVDSEDRIVGIITIDDIIDIIEEDTTEDFHKMAAITPSEEGYLKTSVINIQKTELYGYTLLMIFCYIHWFLLTSFETNLSKEIALVGFLPLLMD
jgi:magnesium transporter